MKTAGILYVTITAILLPAAAFSQQLTAKEIVKKANDKFNGEKSGYSVMSMTIVRPSWQRTIDFRSWSLGSSYMLTLITSPAREKGQSFLKRANEMWSWNPSVNRLIKLPPSMMSQGWMGSDYTNDDILKESSVVNDYSHVIEGSEIIGGRDCYRIRMTALPESGVLWGHQIRWIDKRDFLVLKAELYDEDGILVRTEKASEIKMMDGRLIPTLIELFPAEEKNSKTIVRITEVKFNIDISESYFSQQNMKNLR